MRPPVARASLLVLAAALLYVPALLGGRITDDSVNYRNAREAPWTFSGLSNGFRVGLEFAHDGVRPAGIADSAVYFRPLPVLSFKLELFIFGTDGRPCHLVNLLLQGGCAFLLYLVGLRVLRDPRAALLAAALFLLHPASLFTAYWLSSRTDLLADLFMLAALLPILGGSPPRTGRIVASLALFACALLSKESAAVFPSFAFCALLAAGERPRAALLRLLPHLVLLPFWWMLRTHFIGGFHLPDVGFYTIFPGDPLFPLHALQRIVLAFLTLAAWFPTFPVKPLLPYPAWNLVFFLVLVPAAWGAFRLLFRAHPHPARRDALLCAALLLHAPTLWFLPAPHYFHGAALPFSLALAETLAAPGRPRRRLLAPYLSVALLCAALTAGAFGILLHFAETKNRGTLELLSATLGAIGRAAPGRTAEIHLVDLPPHAATILAEHRLRHPGAPPFAGRILTIAGPCTEPARVTVGSAGILLEATGAPYGAGPIEWFAFARPVSVAAGDAVADASHRIEALAVAPHPVTGLPGARRILVTFARGPADAPHRRILHAHPGAPASSP